ncbi:MAG: ORF6N domain-containing protein [Candidatus Methylomirabilis oxyfera]|nr:ORF6N domain-containing protein [Candidatus Methylomirabilis oxyfera]
MPPSSPGATYPTKYCEIAFVAPLPRNDRVRRLSRRPTPLPGPIRSRPSCSSLPRRTIRLRSQIVTVKTRRGQHRKYLPYAFTEHGAIMTANGSDPA